MPARDVIHVFLASPGDLAEERMAAREAVEQVNRTLARHQGVQLELYGWENEPAGFGRPQELINENLDQADVFIGALWRSWGTPSGEDFTSGFHEEYSRACARRSASGRTPAIWLFFKDVDPPSLKDPGVELQKVLAFKVDVQAKREVLYRSFEDAADWKAQLVEHLTEYLAKRPRASVEPDRVPASPSAPQEDPGSVESEPAIAQLRDALARTATSVTKEPARPDLIDAARLLLASFAWVSDLATQEVIDTHELNLFYRQRTTITPTRRELIHLLRSGASQPSVRPMWWWIRDEDEQGQAGLLTLLAMTDAEPAVRRAAARLLPDVSILGERVHEGEDVRDIVIKRLTEDDDTGVRVIGINLARIRASETAISLLENLQEDEHVGRDARLALARHHLDRGDPGPAVALIVVDHLAVVELGELLMTSADHLSEAHLTELMTAEHAVTRELGIRLAAKGPLVSDERLLTALDDPSSLVSVAALDVLLERKYPVPADVAQRIANDAPPFGRDDAEERRMRVMLTAPDELEFSANWYLAYGNLAYEACVRCGQLDVSQVRRDLSEGFATFREQSAAAVEAKFGPEGRERLVDERDYVAREFTMSAARLLGELGGQQDVPALCALLSSEDSRVVTAAFRALVSISPQDAVSQADELLHLTSDKAARRAVAAQVLELEPSRAEELLESDDSEILAAAVAKIGDGEGPRAKLYELLRAEDGDVRLAAARRLAELLPPEELSSLLDEYLQPGSRYFYNVVAYLDTHLHAAGGLRAHALARAFG